MSKKDIKLRAIVAPVPTVVVSAYDENEKPDACTLGLYYTCSHRPPCVTIAINSTDRRKTLKSILKSGAFVVHYPDSDQIRETDYLGVETGYNADKLAKIGYTVTKAEKVNAPVINEMPLAIECKVIHTSDIGSHTQVTGQIMNVQAEESMLDANGRIDIEKLDPMVYDEESHSYRHVGRISSRAFVPGAEMKKTFDKEDGVKK
ncbi:MAG: flavin reductase family protein [Eubacterium sp.]|nr:flavin reductase family protein [Eubacterium sp.]